MLHYGNGDSVNGKLCELSWMVWDMLHFWHISSEDMRTMDLEAIFSMTDDGNNWIVRTVLYNFDMSEDVIKIDSGDDIDKLLDEIHDQYYLVNQLTRKTLTIIELSGLTLEKMFGKFEFSVYKSDEFLFSVKGIDLQDLLINVFEALRDYWNEN